MPTKDGKVKKLDLENGGGSRLCDWFNKDMSLNDIYRLIFNIFKLGNLTKINVDNFISQFLFYGSQADTELETSLYDFQLQPLDVNQYETFLEYIHRNGLNCTSTTIYFLNNARDLLNAMNEPRLLTFRNIIQSIVVDIESILSTINMYNSISINNAKEALTSLRMQYSRIFKSDLFTSSIYRITQPTKQVYKKTLAAINDLIAYLTNYQVQIVENQTKNSNQSSTSLSITGQEQLENKESIQSLKRKSETLHADNYGQSEIRSYSSFKSESLSQRIENTNKRQFHKSN
ncbi:unnamed protein product [Rotaria sp. Silwood1]|nr:unnamed protein product [Rotaria sp. Silwood1]